MDNVASKPPLCIITILYRVSIHRTQQIRNYSLAKAAIEFLPRSRLSFPPPVQVLRATTQHPISLNNTRHFEFTRTRAKSQSQHEWNLRVTSRHRSKRD